MSRKLVCVTPFLPWAGVPHAGGVFTFHYLRALQELGIQVSVIAPATPENQVASGQPHTWTTLLVDAPASGQRWLERAYRQLDVLVRGLTPGPGFSRRTGRHTGVRRLLAEADVVDVQFSQFLPLVPTLLRLAPRAVVVAHEHDVFSQSVDRARTSDNRRIRWIAKVTYRRVRRREKELLDLTDLVLVQNPSNVRLLHSLGVRATTQAVDPFVAIPPAVGPRSGSRVLFVGAFDRSENLEAARWLLDEVWPHIVAAAPTASLVMAGANPPDWLVRRSVNGVEVTGYVADLDDVYLRCDVALAPLTRGAGIKVKVPQAMAFGLPVVATTVGAEGIAEYSRDPELPIVADDAIGFADAVVRLLDDPLERRRIGDKSRAWAVGTYSFDASVGRIADTLSELVAARRAAV